MDGWMDVYTHYTLKTDLAQRFMKYFALYRVLDSRGVKRGKSHLADGQNIFLRVSENKRTDTPNPESLKPQARH